MTCGIYAIICDKTWKSYVGQSVNIEIRTKEHFSLLRRQCHDNSKLQEDFNKYGEISFHIEILELVENSSNLITREKYWTKFGFNLYNRTFGFREIPTLSENQKEKFWSKTKASNNCCIEWTGRLDAGGYGVFQHFAPHRVAYYQQYPKASQDAIVCHKCDNRRCVNYKHLFLGTYQENQQDRLNKNGGKLLTKDQVLKIREKFKENPNISASQLNMWTLNELGINMGSRKYIIAVAIGNSWPDKEYVPPARNMRAMTYELAKTVREQSSLGLSTRKIVVFLKREHNVTVGRQLICDIVNNKIY